MQFWQDIMMLSAEKMTKLNDGTISIADKISLYDCKVWAIFRPLNTYGETARLNGNQFYSNLQYERAIDAYNASLCFNAFPEQRGIAYANRAAAYLALRSFQDCLDSNRLAKEYALPEKTKIKVLARDRKAMESLALKVTSDTSDRDFLVELSYQRHQRIQSFVYCLELKEPGNPYGGIITNKDLLTGDVLVLETPLVVQRMQPLLRCDYCRRNCGSLKPCDCRFLMFCSPKCKEDAFQSYHNLECSLLEHLYPYSPQDCLVFQIFFKLIQRFKDIASLREYLRKIQNPNPFEDIDLEFFPDAGSFESQFRLYYVTTKSPIAYSSVNKDKDLHVSMAKTAMFIDIIKSSKLMQSIAKSTEDWSFLSEQLCRLIFCRYSYSSKKQCRSVQRT